LFFALYKAPMPNKETAIKHTTLLATFLLIVWGFYRMLFKLPVEIEELFVKPLIWLVPVYFLVKKEKGNLGSLGVTTKNLFPSLYLALALGVLFALEAVIINFVKYESIDFSANLGQDPFLIALGLSFATAVSEEIAFRGYLFNRVWRVLGDEWRANLITSTIWALIHVPIAIFWWELNPTNTVLYLFLTTLFGIGSAWVFARTKNVASSILLHVLWEWPIILFR